MRTGKGTTSYPADSEDSEKKKLGVVGNKLRFGSLGNKAEGVDSQCECEQAGVYISSRGDLCFQSPEKHTKNERFFGNYYEWALPPQHECKN